MKIANKTSFTARGFPANIGKMTVDNTTEAKEIDSNKQETNQSLEMEYWVESYQDNK